MSDTLSAPGGLAARSSFCRCGSHDPLACLAYTRYQVRYIKVTELSKRDLRKEITASHDLPRSK
ncbi:MAG: hypothetical protein QF732_09475 [Nitrospinaceae bacterium]|nr:hypothetical protein [Nitrospinaceae bacterium]